MSSPVIEFADGAFQVEASVIATGFNVEPAQVLILMRSGEITSICEQGLGADVGFHRLTFYYRNRGVRLVIDGVGQIVRRSSVDFGKRERRPGKQKSR